MKLNRNSRFLRFLKDLYKEKVDRLGEEVDSIEEKDFSMRVTVDWFIRKSRSGWVFDEIDGGLKEFTRSIGVRLWKFLRLAIMNISNSLLFRRNLGVSLYLGRISSVSSEEKVEIYTRFYDLKELTSFFFILDVT